jgi:integrase
MVKLEIHQIRLEEGKGGKWRTTITPPALTEAMLNLLPIKIPRRTIQYKFQQLSKKILGKKMSFHTLRHGFGNYQANVLRVPLPIVQQMMGHSRLDTTGIYTKANPEEAIAISWKAMGGGK